MSQGMADELRVRSAMDHDGTVSVGTYRMMTSGNGVGATVPKEHARRLGLLDARETEVYVNYELGVVMHRIPEPANDE